MSSETSSPETSEKTPEQYPGVFNTVVPYENFYMSIGVNRLKAKDIIGVWRYMHNLFVAELKTMDVIDKFGRIKASPFDTLETIYAEFWIVPNVQNCCWPPDIQTPANITSLARMIATQIIAKLSEESVEWTKIYPFDMLIMPIVQDIYAITRGNVMNQVHKISGFGDIGPFELRLDSLSQYSFHIDYDVKSHRNMITLKMVNQYGTDVMLNIKSNTRNLDSFINMVDERFRDYRDVDLERYLKTFTFSFGLSRDMSRKRKLLLSVTSKGGVPSVYHHTDDSL